VPVPAQTLPDALAYIFADEAKGAGCRKQDCAGICQASGIEGNRIILRTNTRGRGDGALVDWEQERLDNEISRIKAKALQKAARCRQRCGAKTRKGHPCKMMSEAGKRRCKYHGGMSTGPKTPEGKARIAEAQRKRWVAWRKAHQDP